MWMLIQVYVGMAFSFGGGGYHVIYSLILARSLLSHSSACPFCNFSLWAYRSYSLVIAEERVLVLADLDGRTTELGNQDLVTGLDGRGDALAITVEGAGADSEDLSLVELLDGRLGEEDATGGLGLGLDALDKDAVEQGSESLDGLGGDGGL